MLSAEQFIAILQQKDLLPPEVLDGLRQQVQESKKPLGAATLAQRLIRQKLLTPIVVERLMAAAGETGERALVPPQFKQEGQEELGLAPLDDELAPTKPGKGGTRQPAKLENGGGSASKKADSPGAPARSLLDEELSRLDSSGKAPLDALMAGPALDDAAEGDPLSPRGRKKRSLRRLIRDLWRGRKGPKKEVVFVQATDTRNAILVISTWGGAVLLLVAAFAVFWYFSAPSSAKMLAAADRAYENGQYAEAVKQYSDFLEQYPKMEQASEVRVRVGLAQLRQAAIDAQECGDWSPAFQTAQEVMKKMQSEAALREKEYAADVAVSLAAIAEGLARQAREQPGPVVVDQARAAMGLIAMSNIREAWQPVDKLKEINELLVVSERQVACARELERALGAIQEAIDGNKPLEAYTARNAAVSQYPELAENARLEAALDGAAKSLLAAAKTVQERRAAETTERPSGILATVVLAHRVLKGEVPGVAGKLVFASAEGAVYALDAATGTLRWRRFLSAPREGKLPVIAPLPLSRGPRSDVVLCDPVQKEVLKIDGRNGALLWRFALLQAFAASPVQAGNRLFVPTEDSRLVVLDLLTGNSSGYLRLPQPCHVPATYDAERSLIYLVADQSTLYVLSSSDGECRQVFHLGHEPGGVAAPPVVDGNFLLVAVNGPGKESTLRALSLPPPGEARSSTVVRAVQQVRLKGLVKTPPLVGARRVLVVTSHGGLHVFGLDPAAQTPLSVLARGEPTVEEEQARFPLLQGSQFWVADTQLARYEIRGRIILRQVTDQGNAFVQPLLHDGQAIYCALRKPKMAGVTVSAVSMDKNEPLWQTVLAVPLAGEPMVDPAGGKLTAVTTGGGMYPLGPAEIAQIVPGAMNILEKPEIGLDTSTLLEPIRNVVPMAGGMFAMTAGAGSKDILLYDPSEPLKRFRYLLAPQPMACPPLPMAGGLLIPCKDGSVALLDPKTAGSLAKPFQKPADAGSAAWNWRPAAAVGPKEAVLSNGGTRLFRMAVTVQGDPPAAEVTAAAEGKSDAAISSPLAVVGNVAYAVDGNGAALAFELPALTPGKKPQALAGRCAWGPRCVGKLVLVATDKDRLYAFSDRQELVWQTPLRYGPLAGTPAAAGDSYYLASKGGTIWRISAASGEEQGKVETGVPLDTGPVLLGERLFLAGHDGTLYEAKRP